MISRAYRLTPQGTERQRARRTGARRARHSGKTWVHTVRTGLEVLVSPAGATAALGGFLLARVAFLGELSPFAVAFVAAIRVGRPRLVIGAVLGAAVGLLTGRQPAWVLEGLALLLVTWGVTALPDWSRPRFPWRPLAAGGIVLVGTLAVGAVALLWTGVTAYGLARTAVEAVLAALFTLVALDAVPVPPAARDRSWLSVAVLVALAVEGLGDWGLGFIRARRVAGATVVMLAGSVAGGPAGAAAGVLVGTIALLCSTSPQATLVALPGVAGLLAGTFRSGGRFAVAAGYLVGGLAMVPLAQDPAAIVMAVAEAGVAAVLYLLTPARISRALGDMLTRPSLPPSDGERGIGQRLAAIGEALSELSCAAAEAMAGHTDKVPVSATGIFEAIAARQCESCHSRSVCWERDFCRTHQVFYEAVARAEEAGELGVEELPASLRRRCSRPVDLARAVTFAVELKRQEDYWRRRWTDAADVLRGLLDGLAEALLAHSAVAGGTSGPGTATEERLAHALQSVGFRVVDIRAGPYPGEVRVVGGRCPGFDRCRTAAVPAARAVLGYPVAARKECEWVGDGLRCLFVLGQAPDLGFRVGVARLPKDRGTVAGDSFLAKQLAPGKLLLALSNGMGAGEKAAAESQATLALLEKALRAGFAADAAIRLLNGLLLCRNVEESFATLDLAVVDLGSGEADLVKLGACPSFLRRPHGEVLVVGSPAPPLGILRRVDPVRLQRTVREGDLLVMVTDGLADPTRRGRRPDWLVRLLESPSSLEPQALASEILEAARSMGGHGDDMTALVAGFCARLPGEGKTDGGGES